MDVLLLLGEVPCLFKVRVVVLVTLPYTGELLWQIYPRFEGGGAANAYDKSCKHIFLVYENTHFMTATFNGNDGNDTKSLFSQLRAYNRMPYSDWSMPD
jgi:hypothetical protein